MFSILLVSPVMSTFEFFFLLFLLLVLASVFFLLPVLVSVLFLLRGFRWLERREGGCEGLVAGYRVQLHVYLPSLF